MPMRPPLSSGVVISAITPAPVARLARLSVYLGSGRRLPIDIVAELPTACTARKTIRKVRFFAHARPMFAASYTRKVAIKTGRLPIASAKLPQKEGARPWKTMYMVIVKVTWAVVTCSACMTALVDYSAWIPRLPHLGNTVQGRKIYI